jgi:hypothetical protein
LFKIVFISFLEKEIEMKANKKDTQLVDVKVNVKIVLAALWIAHFLLWTFGDMAALLQEITEPIDNNSLLFVAVPLAIIQALMVFFSLTGKAKIMRWVNVFFAIVFLVFNVGFLFDAHVEWEYLLGTGYLLVNGLTFWRALKWPKQEV